MPWVQLFVYLKVPAVLLSTAAYYTPAFVAFLIVFETVFQRFFILYSTAVSIILLSLISVGMSILLLVIAYALMKNKTKSGFFSPTIIDFEIFPVYDCILARDRRMYESNGGWFGLFETPAILSNSGKRKMDANLAIDYSAYGRKENEGKDLNEDTNFGK